MDSKKSLVVKKEGIVPSVDLNEDSHTINKTNVSAILEDDQEAVINKNNADIVVEDSLCAGDLVNVATSSSLI